MTAEKKQQIAEFIELAAELDTTELFILWRALKAGDAKAAERDLAAYSEWRAALAIE